jgi:hypothetical protein
MNATLIVKHSKLFFMLETKNIKQNKEQKQQKHATKDLLLDLQCILRAITLSWLLFGKNCLSQLTKLKKTFCFCSWTSTLLFLIDTILSFSYPFFFPSFFIQPHLDLEGVFIGFWEVLSSSLTS